MKHYGDITKIKGSEVPIVDIVCGGSPCQDLSVAGARKGLAGERSGLFMEQIRIIKEMNKHVAEQLSMRGANESDGLRPVRYMVWENVPGALSSGTPKSEDFRIVLEETAKVADESAVIPGPPKGKWTPSGCIMADRWSIAWRVHDAQFWGITILDLNGRVVKKGTPQRRKRISLVADFRGKSAPKILFESKSVSGDSTESGEEGQGTTPDTERSTDTASYTLKIRGGVDVDSNGRKAGKGALIQTELSGTLGVSQDQTLISVENQKQIEEFVDAVNADARHQQDLIQSDLGIARTLAPGTHASGSHLTKTLVTKCLNEKQTVYGISPYGSNSMLSDNPHSGIYEAETSRTLDLNGGSPACNQGGMAVVCIEGNGARESHKGDGFKESETMYTLNTVEQHAVAVGVDLYNQTTTGEKSKTLNSIRSDADHVPCVTYGLDRASFNQGENAQYDISIQEDIAQPLVARGPGGGNAEQVSALCARDWKGVGNQYVSDGKLIVQPYNGHNLQEDESPQA